MADVDLDPYKELGLSDRPDASDADIRQAYRKLSLKYHPDRNADPGATAIFQRLTAAKDILLDTEAKQAFQNLQRAKQRRQQQDDELAANNADRANIRAAMRAELARRERESASALSDLQRAKAAVAEQLSRLRSEALAKARARPAGPQGRAAGLAAAAARPATPAEAAVAPPLKRTRGGAAVDAETLAQLRRSLKVRWRREQAAHDAVSLRAAFEAHGPVEHVVLRGKPGREASSAVVVMATAEGAARAVWKATGPPEAPLLVVPLPAVADMAALDGGTEVAVSAAAALRRQGIAAEAPPAATPQPSGKPQVPPHATFLSFPGARPARKVETGEEDAADVVGDPHPSGTGLKFSPFPGARPPKNAESAAGSRGASGGGGYDACLGTGAQQGASTAAAEDTAPASTALQDVPHPISPDPGAENKSVHSAEASWEAVPKHRGDAVEVGSPPEPAQDKSTALPLREKGVSGDKNGPPPCFSRDKTRPPPYSSFPVADNGGQKFVGGSGVAALQKVRATINGEQATNNGALLPGRGKALSREERRSELLAAAEAEDD